MLEEPTCWGAFHVGDADVNVWLRKQSEGCRIPEFDLTLCWNPICKLKKIYNVICALRANSFTDTKAITSVGILGEKRGTEGDKSYKMNAILQHCYSSTKHTH